MDRENGQGEIIVYQAADGLTRVDVRFEGDTVWLTQAQLVDLYHSSKANISEHIKHILEDGELTEEATVRKFRTVQMEGSRQVSREIRDRKSTRLNSSHAKTSRMPSSA